MGWRRFFVIGGLLICATGAWCQAGLEYGLAVANSSTATTATSPNLNRAVSKVNDKLNRTMDAGTKKAEPGGGVTGFGGQQKHLQRQAAPAMTPRSTTTSLPSEISIQGGAPARGQTPKDKYPKVVNLGASPSQSQNSSNALPK